MSKIDNFYKIDLKATKILKTQSFAGVDKLLSLTLDIGAESNSNLFAGIK